MHVSSRLLCFWPGLARLWTKGDGSSLALALGFALILNLALISSFLWPELFGRGFPTMIWPILGVIWIVSAYISHQELAIRSQSREIVRESDSPVPDTLFIQAQREYLRGNWSDAEKLLRNRLQFRPRDSEARLLLATSYRHQGKTELALQELTVLQRFDESAPWIIEIEQEIALNVQRREDLPDNQQDNEIVERDLLLQDSQDLPKTEHSISNLSPTNLSDQDRPGSGRDGLREQVVEFADEEGDYEEGDDEEGDDTNVVAEENSRSERASPEKSQRHRAA